MKEDKSLDFYGYKVAYPTNDLLDDADIVDLLDDLQSGEENSLKVIKLLKKLVGDEEYTKIRAFFVKKEGKFSATKAGELAGKLMESFDPKD